jgi:hypothetical protein
MATEIVVTDEFKLWFEGLNESEQEAIESDRRFVAGPRRNSRVSVQQQHQRRQGRRAARIAHSASGPSLPHPVCLRPIRQAVLLVGGDKTGDSRWYEKAVPLAEKLFSEYLRGLGY